MFDVVNVLAVGVSHRIGGLEIVLPNHINNKPVSHRIGGLENNVNYSDVISQVSHRIGGLEI